MLGNAIDPPYPPGSFDLLTNRWVLWTLIDPERAFRNWFTVLRSGGQALVIDSLHPPDEQKPAWSPYTPAVATALPMRGLRSAVEPELLAAKCGFVRIRTVVLDEINNLEQMLHPDAGAASSPRYALIMDKP